MRAGAPWMFALALASCGGVGTGGTGTYVSGPIAGFGSILVSGVRLDERSAELRNDDGEPRSAADLQLGVTVEVDAGNLTPSTPGDALSLDSAVAQRITLGSEIVGPVSAIAPGGIGLKVLGQPVLVSTNTAYGPSLTQGLVSIRPGMVVQVYGFYDAAEQTQKVRATRIEEPGQVAFWRVRGPIKTIDPVAKTLTIGTATFGYASATGVPQDLPVGRTVRLRVAKTTPAPGRFDVLSFAGDRTPLADWDAARLGGYITEFMSLANFSIGGIPVDASAATIAGGTPALGVGILARGPTRGGVLRAETLLVQTEERVMADGFIFQGPIESIDLATQTLVLKGTALWWGRPPLVNNGTLADLVPGRAISVRAVKTASGRFEAVIIRLD